MNKPQITDAKDAECTMAAVAILAGCDKTADELIAGWRTAKQDSPLAVTFSACAAKDEADRAVQFAGLQARATSAAAKRVRADALAHAESCMAACGGWTVETLGHHIESAFGEELDSDECDDLARKALGL